MNKRQLDVLNEVISIGIGRSTSSLNTLTNSHIDLSVPLTQVMALQEFKDTINLVEHHNKMSLVKLSFDGEVSGAATLLFSERDAQSLIEFLMNAKISNHEDMDALSIGVLLEIGNIVLNGLLGVIGNTLQEHFNYQVPSFEEVASDHIFEGDNSLYDENIIVNKVSLHISELKIKGEIILFFQLGSLEQLIQDVDRYIVESLGRENISETA